MFPLAFLCVFQKEYGEKQCTNSEATIPGYDYGQIFEKNFL